MSTRHLLERRQAILGRNAPLFYERPLHIVRGDGVWLYGADGRRYLDAYNNVAHVGHSHPRVVEAIAAQARTLNTSARYLHETIVDYAERLAATFDPGRDMMVMFCCSGSEANELALRIVRECSGRRGVISTAHSYHGNTAAVSQVSSILSRTHGPEVRRIPAIDPYRDGPGPVSLLDRYCTEVAAAIDGFAQDALGLAGLLLCTGLSSEGLPKQPFGYMKRAAEMVRAAGHRHARQAHGQRPPARRRDRAARSGIARRYELVGATMARMREQTAGWRHGASFERHSWCADSLAGERPLWGRFWELAALVPAQRALMLRLRDALREDLARLPRDGSCFGLIHADLVPENLLVHQGEVHVIDFDDAGHGWHLFDIATTLYFLQRQPGYGPPPRAARRIAAGTAADVPRRSRQHLPRLGP